MGIHSYAVMFLYRKMMRNWFGKRKHHHHWLQMHHPRVTKPQKQLDQGLRYMTLVDISLLASLTLLNSDSSKRSWRQCYSFIG